MKSSGEGGGVRGIFRCGETLPIRNVIHRVTAEVRHILGLQEYQGSAAIGSLRVAKACFL